MNTRNQLICAWAGPVFLVLFFIGLWPLADFFPPLQPSADAASIAARYAHDATMIRLGMLVMMTGAAFQLPFAAVISIQLQRIEGRYPVMAYTQLGAGALAVLILTIPELLFVATAFRPDRGVDMIWLMNDMAWIAFVMPYGPAFIQSLAIGFGILADTGTSPVFPRWLAFFNFWTAILYLPGGGAPFFKEGPFAWNGLFAFWVPAVVFGIWFLVMFSMLLKAIRAQAHAQ